MHAIEGSGQAPGQQTASALPAALSKELQGQAYDLFRALLQGAMGLEDGQQQQQLPPGLLAAVMSLCQAVAACGAAAISSDAVMHDTWGDCGQMAGGLPFPSSTPEHLLHPLKP